MTRAGDVIENPVTGERIVFVETSADTAGERLKIDLQLAPTAFNAATHRHTKQRERIAITEGELRIVVGGAEAQTLRAGEEVMLPAGVPHVWWNESGKPARVMIEYEPALNTEQFFQSFFALGRDGRTDAKGMPSFLQGVLMMPHFEIFDGKAPVWVQRVVCAIFAPLALALGYRAEYAGSESQTAAPLPRAVETDA